jgi:hypothetical protein
MGAKTRETWASLLALIGIVALLPGLVAQEAPRRDQPRLVLSGPAFPAEQPAPAPEVRQPIGQQQQPPKVSFVLKDRHGHATPSRTRTAHTGGGNVDVAQPSDDKLVITMTGVVTAGPHPCEPTAASMAFDLDQAIEIAFADPKLKKAKLTVEIQAVGLLRGDKQGGTAAVTDGGIAIASEKVSILSLALEGHSVCGEDNLAINDRKGPVSVVVPAGDFRLLQSFHINANHTRGICGKASAAEFAPDPALDPTWISVTDPFRGANKKEFGFRAILRVEPE